MRTLVIAFTTVAAVGALAAVPAAGAAWTAPQTLSRSHTYVFAGNVEPMTNGAAVASWAWQDGISNGATTGRSMAVRAPANPSFGTERDLPPGVVSGPKVYDASHLLVATLQEGVKISTLNVRFGDLSGRFGRPHVVMRSKGIRGVQLAVNTRGDAVLGWWTDDGPTGDRAFVSLRRHGGSFGPPTRLASGRIRSTSVAIGARGDVLAAWDARGVVRTRFKARSERRFHRSDELRSRDAFYATLQTAVAADGRAWVAWTAQLLTEGGDSGEGFVQVATRTPGGRRFQRALLLDHTPDWAVPSPVSLAIGRGATAFLAWDMWDGGPARQPGFTHVRAAKITAGGATDVTLLARFPSIELRDSVTVAAGSSGHALVLWTQLVDALADTSQLFAAELKTSGDWGAPEPLPAGLAAAAATAAYPAAGPDPIILFANRLLTRVPQAVLQATTRGAVAGGP